MENPQSTSKSQDLQNVIAADLPLAISKLNDIKSLATAVNQMVRSTINRVKNEELPMDKGMSFLDVKNHMLLKYIINLNCLLLKKVSGGSIKDNSCIGNEIYSFHIMHIMSGILTSKFLFSRSFG